MSNGIYAALSGAMAGVERLDSVANNLANVSTPGFRQEQLTFSEVMRTHELAYSKSDGAYLKRDQGALHATGRPLDVAVEGRGYFSVDTPNGTLFTRNGHFQMDPDGTLVTSDGMPVRSLDGPIRLPRDAQVRFGEDGHVYAGDADVGTLAIADIDEKSLRAVGGGLYAAQMQEPVQALQNPVIKGGTLEASNVNALSAMTELIETSRMFDAAQKSIETYRQIDSRAANELSR